MAGLQNLSISINATTPVGILGIRGQQSPISTWEPVGRDFLLLALDVSNLALPNNPHTGHGRGRQIL